MASNKKLEDIIEPQNIRMPEPVPSDFEDKTHDPMPTAPHTPAGLPAGVMDFRYLGIKYKASDLYGYGFDSTCSTCHNHYTIVFVNKALVEESYVIQNQDDYILVLPVSNDITNGHDFCAYIIDELNKPKNKKFIHHYQQYAFKNEQLYVYDDRGNSLGSFFTSVHILAIALEAEYKGPGIKVGNQYDKEDVAVTVTWSDGTSNIVKTEDWQASSLTVTQIGPNIFIAFYRGLEAEYVVNGFWIKEIVAKYLGPDIPVQECYDTHDVEVTATYYDGSTAIIPWEELIWETNLRINDNGLLRKFVSYVDQYSSKYTVDYFVPGVPRPIQLHAKYLSVRKIEGTKIEKEELRVWVTYLLNDFDEDHRQTEDRYLQKDEWEFLETDIVDKDNDGTLMVQWIANISFMHFRFITSIQVKFIDGTDAYLIAWYEGPDIEVGENYDLDHVVIYLCEPNKDRIRLHYLSPGVIINRDTSINKEGDNEFEVSYQHSRWLLKTKYYVPGIISKIYPDIPFKVVYIEKDTFKETDLTEDFLPYFTYLNCFSISWNQFMLRIRDYVQENTPYFGMFRVDAPKRTGLWNKYASSWHVYVFNTRDLIAEIYKIYCDPIKEDETDGENQESV